MSVNHRYKYKPAASAVQIALGVNFALQNLDHRLKKKENGTKNTFEIFKALPVLQVLDAAKTSEPAIHHDGHPGAKSLTLLHTATQRETLFRDRVEVIQSSGSEPGYI